MHVTLYSHLVKAESFVCINFTSGHTVAKFSTEP